MIQMPHSVVVRMDEELYNTVLMNAYRNGFSLSEMIRQKLRELDTARYPSVTEEPQVPDCAQCATYQHDVSYHDDERYPSVTDEEET